MHIIGTSGHVDHGKTALIEALTGINADRLPEEKKRGMTIDLGFAHFDDEDGVPVGVIDVPGHERFIRNMVAGAWSLSCAVLVVAGNEGWMQQTEDHARVLEAMGIGEIICALTKIDIAEKDTLEYMTEAVRENLRRIFGKDIDIIPVSSITGEGIDLLRRAVLERLKTIPEIDSGSSGFVHVDRAFSIKGAGTVITGSLSGGELSEGEELTILPGGLKTKIRGIQSYYSSVKTAQPVSRVAFNLQGIKKEDVSRGSIAAKNPEDFSVEKEFIISWEEQDKDRKTIKNHMELEIAWGTGHHTGRIHFLRTEGFARIVLNNPVPVSFLEPCLFIQQGGHRFLGKGRFIWAGETDRHFRIRLSGILEKYPVPEKIKDEPVLGFILNGWYTPKNDSEKAAVERFTASEKLESRRIGETIILEEGLRQESERLRKLSSRRGGVRLVEYLHSGDLPEEVKNFLLNKGHEEQVFIRKEQLLLSPDQAEGRIDLTPLGKKILQMLSRQKNRGLQLKEVKEPGAKREMRNLVRVGKVIALEGDIYFSTSYFNKLTETVLEGLEPGSLFSIPEAKEKTGLSRRYIIPLLNKMEEMDMVKRRGDMRIVC